MTARRDTTKLALDVLTDLGLSRIEALRRFAKIARRWTAINRCFIVWCGGVYRVAKAKSAYDDAALARWADDGGRA